MTQQVLGDKERYFNHEVGVGIVGYGENIEKSFVDAAKSAFALIADLDRVHPSQIITFEFDEFDVELALITWLKILLDKAKEHDFIFSDFGLKHDGKQWKGTAAGEKRRKEIERGVEVKGVTATMLSVKKIDHIWEARCVVDV